MKYILVTGGAGYIGSHTAKALARAGYQPIVIDNLSTGHRRAVKWGPLIEGDVADRDLVRRVLEEHRIDSVLHFAANASVSESMADPHKYLHDNVSCSLELLQAMRESGVRRIVFSSTCAVYGKPRTAIISESTRCSPVNPYGESKLFLERALEWHEKLGGLSWVALRYFNAAGADPEGEIGEDHDPETHLVPLVIQAALGQRRAVNVMGTDYPTSDGTAVRDYIHVSDLADSHIRALEYLQRGGKSRAFNVGTGQGHSVREVIAAVERVGGRSVPVREMRRRPGDPASLIASNKRTCTALRWKPRYQNIDAIVRTAWNWHSSRAARRVAAAG